jgi:hypothetical protein
MGVEYRYGRMKITPEMRNTHSNPTSNLVAVMVGVTFDIAPYGSRQLLASSGFPWLLR